LSAELAQPLLRHCSAFESFASQVYHRQWILPGEPDAEERSVDAARMKQLIDAE
jgi:hypothetical protein